MAYFIDGLGQTLNKDFIVTATALNVRREPNAKSQIVSTLKKGDRVRIFSRSGNWGSTVNGWVSMNYLREDAAAQIQNQTPQAPQGEFLDTIEIYEVVANSLNVRERPTTQSKALFQLRKGEKFSLAGKSKDGKWGLIEPTRERGSGWVSLNAQYVRLVSSTTPQSQSQSQNQNQNKNKEKTTKESLPSWIPEWARNSIESATNWIRDQVLRIFGGKEQEIERLVKSLTVQYEAVERLIRNGVLKGNSYLIQTQPEVRDFLSKMRTQAEKFSEKFRESRGLGAAQIGVGVVIVIVAGLAAGVITLQTLQRMREIEVRRESELRKFDAYEDFKKRTGGTNQSAFESLLNSTAQPAEPQQAGFFSSLGSGLQSIATIGLIGAGVFLVYNLIQKR